MGLDLAGETLTFCPTERVHKRLVGIVIGPSPPEWRDSPPLVFAAQRCVGERARALSLTRDEWRVLSALGDACFSWCCLARPFTVEDLTRLTYPGLDPAGRPNGRRRDRVATVLGALSTVQLVVYLPGRGARSTVMGFPPCPHDHGHIEPVPSARPGVAFGGQDRGWPSKVTPGGGLRIARPYMKKEEGRTSDGHMDEEPVEPVPPAFTTAWKDALADATQTAATRRSERAADGDKTLPAYFTYPEVVEDLSEPYRGSNQ